MGKQSRRKNAGNTGKKARKEELRERREYVLQAAKDRAAEEEEEAQQIKRESEIRVRDRVWFNDGSMLQRGVVQRVPTNGRGNIVSRDLYKILPLSLETEREHDYAEFNCERNLLTKDPFEWSLRFMLGDFVAIFHQQLHEWIPCTVTKLFPDPNTYKTNPAVVHMYHRDFRGPWVVAAYLCTELSSNTFSSDSSANRSYLIYEDVVSSIDEYYPSPRFHVGDQVRCNVDRFHFVLSSQAFSAKWMTGTIQHTQIMDRDDYSVYEVTVNDRGRLKTLYVCRDAEDCISLLSTPPRDRLLLGIQQNCDIKFFEELISSNNLDVKSFLNLVLAESIKYANYGMLLWLHKNKVVCFRELVDDIGNNVLHQMATSDFGHRFFVAAGEYNLSNPEFYGFFDCGETRRALMKAKNKSNRTWIEELLEGKRSSGIRSAQHVFSFEKGIGYVLWRAAKDTVFSPGESTPEIAAIWAEFLANSTLFGLAAHSDEPSFDFIKNATSDRTMAVLGADSICSVVNQLLELIHLQNRLKRNILYDVGHFVACFAAMGKLPFIRACDSAVLHSSSYAMPLIDCGEFREQHSQKTEPTTQSIEASLVDQAIIGYHLHNLSHPSFLEYKFILQNMEVWMAEHKPDVAAFCEVSLLSIRDPDKPCSVARMLEHRIYLLSDDDTLKDRLATIEYLVKEEKMSLPSPINIVKWRKSRVLSWLVEESFLALEKAASKEILCRNASKLLTVLGGRQIPRGMLVSELLCLAAVEHDDLRSVSWLHEQSQKIENVTIGHWNIVHVAAFFGRAEILFWMKCSFVQFHDLLLQPCAITPYSAGKFNSVHLAISNGYTFVASRLLSWGCPAVDGNGKDLLFHTKQSFYKPVQAWGEDIVKPMKLGKNINAFLNMIVSGTVTDEDIVLFAEKSKCLDPKTWWDVDLLANDNMDQIGKSYKHVLRDVFSNTSPSLALRLYKVCPIPSLLGTNSSSFDRIYHNFWNTSLGGKMAPHLNEIAGTEFIEELLSGPHAACIDESHLSNYMFFEPLQCDPLLNHLNSIDSVPEQTVAVLRHCWLTVNALRRIFDTAQMSLKAQLEHNGDPLEANRYRCLVIRAAKALNEEQGIESGDYGSCLTDKDGRLKLGGYLTCSFENMKKSSLARKMAHEVYVFLAVQGFVELIEWSLQPEIGTWDSAKETFASRVAAYLGHEKVTGLLLRESREFQSKRDERLHAIILGTAEGGPFCYFEALTTEIQKQEFTSWGNQTSLCSFGKDLGKVCVTRFLTAAANSRSLDECQKIIKWLTKNAGYDMKSFLTCVVSAFEHTGGDTTVLDSIEPLASFLCKETNAGLEALPKNT